MGKVTVRYFVRDVDSAVKFYCDLLGFSVDFRPAPAFAALSRGDLRLLVNETVGPGGAAQPMPDGQTPEPGGWNRIQIEVGSIGPEVARLKEAGARFRNEVVSGFGGKQVLLEDPSGNPIELFERGPADT